MTDDRPSPPTAPTPDAEALERLPADDWAWLIPHLRAVLLAVPDERATPAIVRLRTAPAGRLAGGRTRRELARLVASGGEVWRELRDRVAQADERPDGVDALLRGETPVSDEVHDDPTSGPDPAELDRARERARQAIRERDELRRRLDGAETRAAAAEARAVEAAELARAAEAEAETLRRDLASADAERAAAVDRERRRAASERRGVEEELRRVRRELEEVRAELQRRPEGGPAAARSAPDASAGSRRPRRRVVADRLVPGRPSTLPEGVRRGTREAVDALLHRGRLVLIDGYNVTRTQRDDLPLSDQRRWLVRSLANVVARTGIEPEVVFDSSVAGPAGRQETARGVRVRYTADGLTADDELVFAVEALDRETPVVVVTDDRGLRDRLQPYAVDLLDTTSFRWVLD